MAQFLEGSSRSTVQVWRFSQIPEQAKSRLMIGVDLATLDELLMRVEMSNVLGKRRYVLATENC